MNIITEFGQDSKYIPIVLYFLQIERNKYEQCIRDKCTVDISKISLLENLIASLTFHLGSARINQILQYPIITSNSYEQLWFNISLLNKSSYKMVRNRHNTIEHLQQKLTRLVKFHSKLSFKTTKSYVHFISQLLKVVIGNFKFNKLPNKLYAEDLDILKVYNHHAKGHILLIQSITISLLNATLSKLTIDIKGIPIQPQLILCNIGIIVLDYCILSTTFEICHIPELTRYMNGNQYLTQIQLSSIFKLFTNIQSYESIIKPFKNKEIASTGFTSVSIVNLLCSFNINMELSTQFLNHFNNFIYGTKEITLPIVKQGKLVMNKRTNRIGITIDNSNDLQTIYTNFNQLDKCLSRNLTNVELETDEFLLILGQMGLDVLGLLYFKRIVFENGGIEFVPYKP